jgi:hypothetical protein
MTDFPPVAPPEDGLRAALREARARRTRTAALCSGTALSLVAAALLSLGGSSTTTLLPPTDDRTPRPTSAPSPEPTSGLVVLPLPGAAPSATAEASRGVQPSPTAAPGSSPQPSRRPGRPSPTALPHDLPTTSAAMARADSNVAVPNNCTYFGESSGYCRDAIPDSYRTDGTLQARICTTNATSTALHYPSARELDLAVVQDGRTLWRWSRTHPDRAGAHTSRLPAGRCTYWSTAWRGVDDAGHLLAPGDYTLVATFSADELAGGRTISSPFTLT